MGEVTAQEEDVMAVQNAVRLLHMIADRRAYSRDCDLGEPDRPASIRDAAAYARHALERLEPALERMTVALTQAQARSKPARKPRPSYPDAPPAPF